MSIENIAQYLADQGLGTIGVTINVRSSPAESVEGILLVPTGGDWDAELTGLRKMKFQVVVRGGDYASTMTLAENTAFALVIRQKSVGTAWIYESNPREEPTPFGRDASGMQMVLFNASATWRQL